VPDQLVQNAIQGRVCATIWAQGEGQWDHKISEIRSRWEVFPQRGQNSKEKDIAGKPTGRFDDPAKKGAEGRRGGLAVRKKRS